jgi:hypothetical protein
MPIENHTVEQANADRIKDWLANRGGLFIWKSVNLSNPGASWTGPAKNADGSVATKPSWQSETEPSRHITDIAEVDVITHVEVKRFHVAVRAGGQGMSLKVTDGGTRRINKEILKAEEAHGKDAWYGFDYGDYDNAVIYVEGDRVPLSEIG